MSAISTVSTYSSDISSLLTSSDSSQSAIAAAPSTSTQSSDGGSDAAATRVDLSDKVKAILARANTDQDVAELELRGRSKKVKVWSLSGLSTPAGHLSDELIAPQP